MIHETSRGKKLSFTCTNIQRLEEDGSRRLVRSQRTLLCAANIFKG